MVLLRPSQDGAVGYPSGLCVVCAQLCEDQTESGEAIRCLQACGLTRSIEVFNADFHVPIIFCGTMNCTPRSRPYEILNKGIDPQDHGVPGPPGKPTVQVLAACSVRLRWKPPAHDETRSPRVDRYLVTWVPGGTRFLRGETMELHEADCLVYDTRVDTDQSRVRTVQNPLRTAIITGLSSGLAYEFRVSAGNAMGQGPWSKRSEPTPMPVLGAATPEEKVLLGASSIRLIRARQEAEEQRRAAERLADPRGYQVRKLVKLDGLVDMSTEKLHPFSSVSGGTPRYSNADIHPDLANLRGPRGVWPVHKLDASLARRGVQEPEAGSGGQREQPGHEKLTGEQSRPIAHKPPPHERANKGDPLDLRGPHVLTPEPSKESGSELVRGTRVLRIREQEHMERRTREDGSLGTGAHEGRSTSRQGGRHPSSHGNRLPGPAESKGTITSGQRSPHQTHVLGLQSAYGTYSCGGEPLFTAFPENVPATLDYIFSSSHSLYATSTLSLPQRGELLSHHECPLHLRPSKATRPRPRWEQEPREEGFAGHWSPYLVEKKRQQERCCLPNQIFASDHLMLLAHFSFSESLCSSTWNS